ncbi:HAD-superfamily hydrolase, subfamily IA, variant 3 [Cyanobacterium stanieri PCC 7202]|uniref:HAD-superfamily hydrolase, subfamily IA, variant 3 n=1 Tax=Cyanobacterium stanieri (strain ATCC 29140 / PCC 7202) TaxID=292563 RepID=K9YKK4_CYASC|nr:HAD-superfamily hydrolase, subfamily IA, variant 3 [Cyanobacterium stanieri PCC 7202]
MSLAIKYEELEAIIFDLGGVIIEVDMGYPYRYFAEHSSGDNDILIQDLRAIALSYEIGKIADQEFIEKVRETTKLDKTDEEIKTIWNGMLGQVPSELGELLYKIKQEKKTFILSNTNPIHIAEVEKRFQQSITQYPLNNLFDEIYYSHNIGLHKPDQNIYNYVIEKNNLNPQHTLFIDDNIHNVNSAKALGIQTIHMNPPMNLPAIMEIIDN